MLRAAPLLTVALTMRRNMIQPPKPTETMSLRFCAILSRFAITKNEVAEKTCPYKREKSATHPSNFNDLTRAPPPKMSNMG